MPCVDALLDSLAQHFVPVRAPGIDVERGAWVAVLKRLCRAAPWERLSDSVEFRFDGDVPELADAVAILLGLAGEQRGIALFPTSETCRAFRASAERGDRKHLVSIDAIELFLDPEDELGPGEVEACRKDGLALPGGLYPRVAGLRGGAFRTADARAQRVLLSAVQAITALTVDATGDLERVRGLREVRACLGTVRVRSTPSEPPELLVGGSHQVLIGPMSSPLAIRSTLGVVVKVGKREAERLARVLAQVDGVRTEPDGDGHLIWVSSDGLDLGPLFRLGPEGAASASAIAGQLYLMLGIAAGGGRRPGFDPRDAVFAAEVRVGGPAGTRHDPVFDRPMSEWPKASATLLAFATAVFGYELGALAVPRLRELLEVAAAVWSAVNLADFGADESSLAMLRTTPLPRLAARAPIDELIAAKRRRLRGDPRIFGNVTVTKGRLEQVNVVAAIPAGYRVGSA